MGPIWTAATPSAKPQLARFPGFSPQPAGNRAPRLLLTTFSRPREALRVPPTGWPILPFVVHIQRLCLCTATLSTDQGKPDGVGSGEECRASGALRPGG